MDIQVSGQGLDLGEALQTHVDERLNDGVTKYFGRKAEAQVTFSKEGHQIRCEITAHLASGVLLAAQDDGGDAYAAFEGALEKLEKRVRRYKRRLKKHHANGKSPLPAETVSSYVLAPLEEEGEGEEPIVEDPTPVVVAETESRLTEMTVGAAVMQLDLVDHPAIVFKNAAHGRINVVYRRADGNIGWIDPTS